MIRFIQTRDLFYYHQKMRLSEMMYTEEEMQEIRNENKKLKNKIKNLKKI